MKPQDPQRRVRIFVRNNLINVNNIRLEGIVSNQ